MTKGTNGKVSLKDVYSVVNRIEDKFDGRLQDLEKRVEVNEQFRYRAMTVAVVIGAGLSLIGNYLISIIA